MWRSHLYNEDFLEIIGKLWQVRGTILDAFVKKILKIDRGNKLLTLTLKKNMVGFSLSEFFLTKKMGKAIHTEKKKGKKRGKKKGYIVNPIGIRLQFHASWQDADMLINYIIPNFSIT